MSEIEAGLREASTAEKPQKEMESEFKRLSTIADKLQQAISRLQGNLVPICRPVSDAVDAKNEGQAEEMPLAPFAQLLREISYRIHTSEILISELSERIEI